MEVGQNIKIHSYKHDKTIHRVWSSDIVLDVTDEMIVVGNYKTKVVESNGRYWATKEPAICFFYLKEWFNVIAMIKEDGIHYYCNISSPSIYDGEAIKYIDYDLDLRVDSQYKYRILDRDEYKHHAKIMNYSDELKAVCDASLKNVIELVNKKVGAFDHEVVLKYLELYKTYNPKVK